ncbi:beta-L-arabinofuranosidase domain-containing protein [Streptomyces sp. L7]
MNARISLPQGPNSRQVREELARPAAGGGRGRGRVPGRVPLVDTDVYKWLEAASAAAVDPGAFGRTGSRRGADRRPGGRRAQQPDGYLNTWFQLVKGGERYKDLRWGHELYCAGHLIQAAVAIIRATGRPQLLDVARKFADHIDSVFGLPGSGKEIDGIDGHPEVETAMLELGLPETGERRYLDLAGYFVDRFRSRSAGRRGVLPGPALPVREADNVEGHAVRQLYLLAAAADPGDRDRGRRDSGRRASGCGGR